MKGFALVTKLMVLIPSAWIVPVPPRVTKLLAPPVPPPGPLKSAWKMMPALAVATASRSPLARAAKDRQAFESWVNIFIVFLGRFSFCILLLLFCMKGVNALLNVTQVDFERMPQREFSVTSPKQETKGFGTIMLTNAEKSALFIA